MKQPLKHRSPGSFVASVAIHFVVIAALIQIAFRYPIAEMTGLGKTEQEGIRYVKMPGNPNESSGGGTRVAESGVALAPIHAPTRATSGISVTRLSDSSPVRAAGGTGSGLGVAGSVPATSVVPRQPYSTIALGAGAMIHMPRTGAAIIDSTIADAIGIYQDSLAAAAPKRMPADWTLKGKYGTWGWGPLGIRLGKVAVPNMALLFLPIGISNPNGPIEYRIKMSIRRDIMEHAQLALAEVEFRASVARIRERRDRERNVSLAVNPTMPSR